MVAPVGGGGLAGGLGVEVVPRGIKLLGVSPEANCAMKRSLEDGRAYTHLRRRPHAGRRARGRGQRTHLRAWRATTSRHRPRQRGLRFAGPSSTPTAPSASSAKPPPRSGSPRCSRKRSALRAAAWSSSSPAATSSRTCSTSSSRDLGFFLVVRFRRGQCSFSGNAPAMAADGHRRSDSPWHSAADGGGAG